MDVAHTFVILLVGHSFVRRLAHYALSARTMNMGLDDRYAVTFVGRGGLTLARLRQMAADLIARNADVIYIDIGTNEIGTGRFEPLNLADEVFEFAKLLTEAGVRRVVISHIFFRFANRSARRASADCNDHVVTYNTRMRELTATSDNIVFWRHRGLWADWRSMLLDGLHFNCEGN